MSVRIAHMDLTAFFVSVERLLNPQWVDKPIMVAGPPEGRGVVTCASYEVRPYGVHAGMATSQALRKCPIAIRVDGHYSAYAEFSERIQQFLRYYSPVFEAAGMDEFYMDWTGCRRIFGGSYRQFARKIQTAITRRFGLPCAIGIASNKTMAKISCGTAKPVGVTEVADGREAEFLHDLDVSVIPGVGEVMLAKLVQRGIRTCGQLAALDSEYVGRVLGRWGLAVQSSARGRGTEYLTVDREQKQISEERTFSEDTRDRTFLSTTLHNMALNVSRELRKQNLRCRCIHVKLRYSDWVTYTRQIMIDPTQDPTVIYQTAWKLLQKADQRRLRIRLVGVGISHLTDDHVTMDLFRLQEEKKEWLLKTVDQINQKFEDADLVRVGCGV